MTVIIEMPLKDFQFWSGGADRAENCTDDDFERIEEMFEELYPEGMTDSEINDFFWFDFDTIARHLGYEDEEDFDRKRDPNYIDDDELEDYVQEWFKDFLDRDVRDTNEQMYLYEEVFGEDAEDLCHTDEERTKLKRIKESEGDYPQWLGEYANEFMLTISADTLMTALFEDDRGSIVLSNFPTKEELREELMTQIKSHE